MNIVLTSNAKFKPYTFDELLKPLLMTQEVYNQVQEGIGELGAKADVFEKLANEQTDPEAYSMYKQYSDDLTRQAEALAKNGLTPSSRQGLIDMKRRYSSEIVPLEQAYKKREELAEEQRKLRAANPSIMFDRDMSVATLSDFVKNPSLGYTSVSGDDLYKKGNAAAKAISLRNLSYSQRKSLGDQYFELTKRQGYSSEEAANWLAGRYNIPELSNAVDRIHSETNTGILNKGDQIRANNYIIDGIMSGLVYGEEKQYKDNKDYLTAYQIQQLNNKGKKETKLSGFSPRIIEGASGEVNKSLERLKGLRKTDSGYSTTELDSTLRELEKAKEEYSKYMNGKDEKLFNIYETSKKFTGDKAGIMFGNSAYSALASTNSNYGEPTGYRRYKELKDKVNSAQSHYDKVKEELKLIEDKYNHLGKTPYDRLYIGSMLEDLQEKQENTSFPLNLKNSDYNNVREGVANILKSFTEKDIEGGALGIRDIEDNKMLDYDDIQDMIKSENLDQIAVKVSGGQDNKLKLVYKGKEHEIEGVEQITKFNKDLKATNDFLKDFSNNVINSITPISDQTLYDIKTKGIGNVSIDNANLKPIEGTNFKGTTLYNASTGELIKVMVDSDNNIVAENSLSEELINKGANRDRYFINMANRGLRGLVPLLASDAD